MVDGARGADGQALRRNRLAHRRNQFGEGDVHGTSPLDVRTAAETVILVLGHGSPPVVLSRRLTAAQLRHEQIRRRPREQEASDDADDDVPAECAH